MTEETKTESQQSVPPAAEPDWYLDDKVPGQGARPEWLPQNFKKVSDVAKSYTELQKKLGGFTGAPENYDLSDLDIDEDQLLVSEMKAVGKELNMSQDGLKKFLGRMASAIQTEDSVHLDEQVKKMGKDGERMLTEYQNWTKDYLKPEETEVVKGWIKNSDDLAMFNKIMANTHMSSVPTANSMSLTNKFETSAELRKEMADNIQRYDNDKAYRANLSSRIAAAVARENR